MTPFDFVVAILAGKALLDLWLEDASFLSSLRARTELWESGWSGVVGKLLNCPFCLSHHTPLWAILWLQGVNLLDAPWDLVARIPLYSLAATAAIGLARRWERREDSSSAATNREDHA